MRRFLQTRWPPIGLVALRRCSTEQRPGNAPHSPTTARNIKEVAPRSAAVASASSPHSTTSAASAVESNEDIADRLAAGRSPHLNAAYHSKWQRTQQQSQTRQKRERQRTTFADEETIGGEASTDLPMVHPGAELPPLRQGKLTEKRVGKFSFVSDPSERASRDFYGHEVPNNTPKPKLPMWASSLTSPALGKVRLVQETWISQDSRGSIDAESTADFVKWLSDSLLPSSRAAAVVLKEYLEKNVVLDLRKATARGIYARRIIKAGEVVLTIPLETAATGANTTAAVSSVSGSVGLTLNSEMLAAHSQGVARRPGLPSYEEIKRLLSVQRSFFDPIPHPVFLDQVHAALLLACEKAEGSSSSLYPYLRLLPADELFDDERIKELHRGVLDPQTHLEYTEHRNRCQHYLRQLHKAWWSSYEAATQKDACGVSEGDAATTASAFAATPLTMNSPNDRAVDVRAAATAAQSPAPPSSAPVASATGSAVATTDCMETKESPIADAAADDSPRPPPSLDDLEWALRVTLSRQRVLPHLRVHRTPFEQIRTESVEGEELDVFGRAIMKAKYAFYRHVLRAIDADRVNVNEVDPSSIPTVVPLLDMLNYPSGGVGNVEYTVEEVTQRADEATTQAANASLPSPEGQQQHPHQQQEEQESTPRSYQVVVRAASDIEQDEELTIAYTKCYSVAYTLYRYGFLPLHRRGDDTAALLTVNRVDGAFRPAQDSSETSARSAAAADRRRNGWWSTLLRRG